MKEALWFSRAIRLFGVKELFDALVNLTGWLVWSGPLSSADLPLTSPPRHALFWATFSLLLGLLLLRYASEIALALVGKAGPRRISASLSPGGNAWLSLGIRSLAFSALLRSGGFLFTGFFAAVQDPTIGASLLGRSSFRAFVWTAVYAVVGVTFSRRPDIIGIFLPSGERAGHPVSPPAGAR